MVSFQEEVVQRLQLGQKRRRIEEQEGESRLQEEAFRREDEAGDPHQTHPIKRQKMMAALEELHVAGMQELHAAHQAVLDNPAAVLAVASAVLNEEDREREERVVQQRRRMAAREEREGVGSSATARARAQGHQTLHAQEGADTFQGVEEGDEGGLAEVCAVYLPDNTALLKPPPFVNMLTAQLLSSCRC